MRANRLRTLWQAGGAAVNGWLAIPSSFSAETMAHQGWDSLTIDLQHGVVDYQAMLPMLQAMRASGVVPMARVPWLEPGIIMKALDAGEGGGVGGRAQPLRLKGPAVESYSFDAELDATDQLEFPDQHPVAAAHGLAPQLALLESLVQPASAQLQRVDREAASGTLEVAPMLAPLLLFAWGKSRVVPVRLAEFSIEEQAFDPALNPILAKASFTATYGR